MSESLKLVIVIIVVAVITSLVIVGTGKMENERKEKNVSKKINAPIEEVIDKDLLVEFKKSFMSECDPFRDQTEYCECGYDEMAKNYSIKEIMQISNELDDGEVPDELLEIFFECYNKVDWSK